MSGWKLLFLLAFLASVFLPVMSGSAETPTAANLGTTSSEILSQLNMSNVFSHIQYFSTIQTRVTGYQGADEAANYIAQQFKSLGLKVEIQEYPVLVPVDKGANITVIADGTTFKAYPLWPNLVQCSPTPPGGVTGRLIYVGSGELEDFDGKEVSESIVLMDFNSMWN